MLGWFRKPKVELPIEEITRQWVDQRWDWLLTEFGKDRLLNVTQILPNPKFFPDTYQGTPEDVRLMLDRVTKYMDLDPARIQMELYVDEKPAYLEKWSSTAGLYCENDSSYVIALNAKNLENPLALVATMAHELSHVHLLGHGRISSAEEDHEPLTDLLTVFYGFGIFTANAVLHEVNWTRGNWSGWSMSTSGYLDMRTFGYALAKFALARNENPPAWIKELRLDVRDAFQKSCRYLENERSQTER